MANKLDSIFGALADPTRRAVVEQLTAGPAPVSDLHAPHEMALPTFLRHLKVLEQSGLVSSTKQGRVRTAQLEPDAIGQLAGWLNDHRTMWDRRMDRLTRLADHMERTKS